MTDQNTAVTEETAVDPLATAAAEGDVPAVEAPVEAPAPAVKGKGKGKGKGKAQEPAVDAEGKPVPAAEPKPRGMGIGAFIKGQILEGVANNDILELVKAKFPEAKTTYASVCWYRNKMRTDGIEVPLSRTLTAAKKVEADAAAAAAAKAKAETDTAAATEATEAEPDPLSAPE